MHGRDKETKKNATALVDEVANDPLRRQPMLGRIFDE